MKKNLTILIALLLALAVAVPAFAVEFKYGGLYRMRFQNNNNLADGNNDLNDNNTFFDQRIRMYFEFVGSENLKLVTKWEADFIWGNQGSGRHQGGRIGADAVNLEMKNAYIDFNIPGIPVEAKMGAHAPGAIETGWVFDDDASGMSFYTNFDPVKVRLGYIAGFVEDPASYDARIDDFWAEVGYSSGPFSGKINGFWQHGRDSQWVFAKGTPIEILTPTGLVDRFTDVQNNDMFDLGLNLGYKADMFDLTINFVKNFGSFDYGTNNSGDYTGYMFEAWGNVYVQNFAFTLGGFYTSGDDATGNSDDMEYFTYPGGASHYWSEIMGLGTLDANVAGNPMANWHEGGYGAADTPSNLWTISVGAAWQALEKTKLTLNYWYIGASNEVIASINADGTVETDTSIGSEIDFYLDQDIVDGLKLRLVGAYLFASDGYSVAANDDDAYELGARLQWSF